MCKSVHGKVMMISKDLAESHQVNIAMGFLVVLMTICSWASVDEKCVISVHMGMEIFKDGHH